jgi:hypothetical protein
MADTVPGGEQLAAGDLVEEQRAACSRQRQRQRVMFGALWRKDGTAMAQCGFELARLQTLYAYPEARKALLQPYDIDNPDLVDGSVEAQDQFIKTCIAKGRRNAG